MNQNESNTNYNQDASQWLWETWLIFSVAIVCALIFVGTLDNSIQLKEYPAVSAVVLINFVTCIFTGLKKR